MDCENKVLGTYRVEMDVEIRAGSPNLEGLLAKVTADGLPCDSGYTGIQGSGLEAMIAAKRRQCRKYLQLSLSNLNDADLALKCTDADDTISAFARDVLTDRIKAGQSGAFAALLAAHAAAADRHRKEQLQRRIGELVSPVAETVNRKGVKELERLAGGGAADPIIAYAAKQRLTLRARRDADIRAIPELSITDLIANVRAGNYAYDSAVKTAANKRIRTETFGSDDIAQMLPLMDHQVKDFLKSRGILELAFLDLFQYVYACERWNKAEVLEGIEFATARLLHRAKTEFKGRLPDDLHAAMLFATPDKFSKAYIKFLARKNRANEHGRP